MAGSWRSSAGSASRSRRELGGAGLGFLEEAVLFEERRPRALRRPLFRNGGPGAAGARRPRALARGLRGGALVGRSQRARPRSRLGGLGRHRRSGAARADGEVLPTVDEERAGWAGSHRTERGTSLPGHARPPRTLAALACEAVGMAQKIIELGGRVRDHPPPVRQADRRLPGGLPQARRHVRRDGAGALARLLGGVVRGRGRGGGAGSRPPPPRPSARRPPSPRASARSRCTAASASRGSTSCTATTSGRSGSRRSGATRRSSGPRSPPRCWTELT